MASKFRCLVQVFDHRDRAVSVVWMFGDRFDYFWSFWFLHIRQCNAKGSDLLLPAEPCNHLWKLVSLICSPPSILGKIDVKSFEHLRVVVVCRSKKLNRLGVVEKRMQFGKVQMVPTSDLNEVLLILVKFIQSGFQISQCELVVSRILCKINKIQ